jgi:hypothetical protein
MEQNEVLKVWRVHGGREDSGRCRGVREAGGIRDLETILGGK